MKNSNSLFPTSSTQIHLGMPPMQQNFSDNTIYLFEPRMIKHTIYKKLAKALTKNGLTGLETEISELLSKDSRPFILSFIIGFLGASNNRKMLFTKVLQQNQEDVLNNSYMHDNGFEKWVLINNPEECS